MGPLPGWLGLEGGITSGADGLLVSELPRRVARRVSTEPTTERLEVKPPPTPGRYKTVGSSRATPGWRAMSLDHSMRAQKATESGTALLVALFYAIVVSGIVATGSIYLRSHRTSTQTQFRVYSQATQFAGRD